MAVGSLANWFGSNRIGARYFMEALGAPRWVGIPFCGGLSEVPYIGENVKILCNDRHELLILLSDVVRDRQSCGRVKRELEKEIFHPKTLTRAQQKCLAFLQLKPAAKDRLSQEQKEEYAAAYFVTSWMSRAGTSGRKNEFKGALPMRFSVSGGCSLVRWKSAIESLDDWQPILQRCSFTCLDFRDFLVKCRKQDHVTSAIYVDSPFPDTAKHYEHGFTEQDFEELAYELGRFKKARVVVRYYDHELIRKLYKKSRWAYRRVKSKKQTNEKVLELLLVNKASL